MIPLREQQGGLRVPFCCRPKGSHEYIEEMDMPCSHASEKIAHELHTVVTLNNQIFNNLSELNKVLWCVIQKIRAEGLFGTLVLFSFLLAFLFCPTQSIFW